MSKKNFLSLALAGTMGATALFAPATTVAAAPSSVSEADALISELNSKEDKIAKQLKKLQKEIKENKENAEELVAEIKETETVLGNLRTEIDELKIVIEKRENHLKDQARALQIVGESGNVVKFVLEADSFNDIIGRIDVVSTIVSSNKQILSEQEEDKNTVEEKEKETVKKQEEQSKMAGKLEANKALLEEKEAEQESLLAKVASEKATVKDERNELVAQAKEAEERRQELASAREAASNPSSSSSNNNAVTTASSSSSATDGNKVASSKPAPAPKPNGGSLIGIAHSLKGIPYSYGGGSTSGFDCSGYTSYVFSQAGRSLPRTAAGQYASTTRISKSEAQPGDLVFFRQGGGIDHVGIYLGGGSFIGSQTSTGVAVSTINSGYWSKYVAGFGR